MLQLISIVMVIYSFFLIKTSIPNLPRMIPTHFNAAGLSDGWGSPDTLWVLLGAQALTCCVFLFLPYLSLRSPGTVHFGRRRLSDFPPSQRERMIALLNQMWGYLNVLMNLFFVVMLRQIIHAAAQPIPRIYPHWPMVLLVGGVVGIMLYYLGKFRRAAKAREGDGPSEGPAS